MKVRSLFRRAQGQTFQVHSGGVHPDGTKIEPEEQIVKVSHESTAPITHGGKELGRQIPVEVTRFMTAKEMADANGRLCGNCKHFDRTTWLKTVRRIEGSGSEDERYWLNMIRFKLLETDHADLADITGDDGDRDVEQILKSMGFCRAIEALMNDGEEYATLPVFGCPTDVVEKYPPKGLYESSGREAAKASIRNRDNIMQRATGKIL